MEQTVAWPGWKTAELISTDGARSLYKITKEQVGLTQTASLTVIRIDYQPQNSPVDNEKKAKEYEENLYRTAAAYMDHNGLDSDYAVRYEDFRYVRHKDGIGHDLLIKSEEITPIACISDFTEDEVRKMGKDICIALKACEKRGRVHGNINQNTVYLSASGKYKLGCAAGIDFQGLADESHYVAPETSGGACDNRSDIYSLGALMLTKLDRSLMDYGSESKLVKIISFGLSFDQSERYGSAGEMLADLSGKRAAALIFVKRMLKGLLIAASLVLATVILLLLDSGFEDWRLSASAHEHEYYLEKSDSEKHWVECECGKHKKETIHSFSLWLSDDGRHWRECPTCGRINGYGDHSYAFWETVIEATEENEGLKTGMCSICAYKESIAIPMLPHTHKYPQEWSRDETYHTKECPCGETVKEEHVIEVWDTILAPTETTEGKSEGRCKVCDYYATQTIPMLTHTHSFGAGWKTDLGSHWHECACGEKKDLASHAFGSWIVTKEATIYNAGMREKRCSVCERVVAEVIPQLSHSHSYGSEWKYDTSSHWRICACGQKADLASHSYGAWKVTVAATISSTGMRERICAQCGYMQKEVIEKIPHDHVYTGVWISDAVSHWYECTCGERLDNAAHAYGEWKITKAPTSTSTGKKQRSCAVCHHTQTETIPINQHTHDFSGEWSRDLSYHWKQCIICGTQEYKSQHSYAAWSVIKEATSTSEGIRQRVCTVCGYTQTEQIPVQLEIDSITLVSKPNKTEYVVGDTLNTSGMTIRVNYSNGLTSTISSGFECTPTSFKSEGQKVITVTYRDKKVTFTVNVSIGYIQKITINSMPEKTVYEIGETLQTNGLTIKVQYTNGQTETISSGFTCSPTTFTSAGTKTITVTYQGKSAAFAVKINEAVIQSIAVKSKPSKTSYSVGSTLNTTGLVLELRYSNGTVKYVTSGFTCTPTKFSSTGSKWITVRYQGFETGFSVSVT